MPRLAVTIQTANRRETAIAAARGELDLALTDGLIAPGDPLPEEAPVTATGLTEVPVRIVLPSDHPLATQRSLRLSDLADARWIAADNIAPSLAEIARRAGTEGFKPAITYTGQDVQTLINLATSAHGLTLLPESILSDRGPTSVRVAHPRLSHRMELIHTALPNRSPTAALAAILSGR
jgi:DNA-binding transcriptional LysR family regulator